MSIDLSIKLTCAVPLASLVTGTEEALQEILQLSHRPSVLTDPYLRGEPVPSPVFELGSKVRIVIKGHDDDPVFLFAHARSSDLDRGEGHGTLATVEVHGGSVGLVLAAAVALAIARECKSEIEDNRPYFTSDFEQSADEFLEALKQPNLKEDLRLAAAELRRSLT